MGYADDINLLGGSIYTIKKYTETLVTASKEIGLEVNADKTKYMVMSRVQDAGRSNNINTNNRSFERMEVFKYLGIIFKSKLYSGGNEERFEVRECLPSFGAESCVFQFAM